MSISTRLNRTIDVDHLAPIVRALGEDARLCVIGNGVGRAVELELAHEERIPRRPNPGPPVIVAGYRDAREIPEARRLALIEHGAGQTYCLAPETRTLTADLRWVPLDEVRIGDELAGFEERPGLAHDQRRSRQWRRSVVLDTDVLRLPCYRLVMADGTKLVASADHLWLRRGNETYGWLRTSDLQDRARFPKHSSKLVKPIEPWVEDTSWGAGYLAAAFDGEGCLTQASRPPRQRRLMLTFTQRENAMLALVEVELRRRGFAYTITPSRTGVSHLHVRGGTREVLRFLGSIRPRRLLAGFEPLDNGQMRGESVEIVESEFIGEQEVVALRTSTGTFLAEGFASHNCDTNRPEGYPGGPGWERASLILTPGPHATARWRRAYPYLRVVEVGCPKLDRWLLEPWFRIRSVEDMSVAPVVAFTFHWPCKQCVETWPAWEDWRGAIAGLDRSGFELLGHWHPRWGDELERWYRSVGIEPVRDADAVLGRADLLVADNTSMLYEFAATGRPVLALNAERWRRDVEHGLRFWDAVPGPALDPVGDRSALLAAAIRLVLDGDGEHLRDRAVHQVYGDTLDGRATRRAVDAIREWA